MVRRSSASRILRKGEFSVHVVNNKSGKRSPFKIHAPTYRHLIEHSMTVPRACVIVQRHSSAIFTSLHFHSRKEKLSARFKNFISMYFIFFFKKTFVSRKVSVQCCAPQRKLNIRRSATSTGNASISNRKFCSSSAIRLHLVDEVFLDDRIIRGRKEYLQDIEYTHFHPANLTQEFKFSFFPSYGSTSYNQSRRD